MPDAKDVRGDRSDWRRIVRQPGGPPQPLADRTWGLLSEAAEGGWGSAGTAYGREEFAALAAKAAQARDGKPA